MAPPVKKDVGYKSEKLQGMVEPLTVRVEKIKNNSRTPIELPAKENSSPGQNFTRDEIPKLELWLLNEWTGGGFYEVKVTDAEGKTMEWSFGWDPRLYPEKIPPNAAGAAVPGMPAPPPPGSNNGQHNQSAGFQVVAPPPFSFQPTNGGNYAGAQINSPQTQPQQYAQMSSPPPFGFPSYPPSQVAPQIGYQMYPNLPHQAGWPTWSPQGGSDNHSRDERKSLEERLRQMELDRLALQHKFEMERQQQEFKEQVRLLQEHKPSGESEDIRRLKEELEKQKLEMERQRQEVLQRELASLKEMIAQKPQVGESEAVQRLQAALAQQREETRRQQEQMSREKESDRLRQEMRDQNEKFERTLRDLSAKQSDPAIEMMRDFIRNQQQNAVNPMQIAQLIKESSSGAHEFSRTVISQFGDIMGVMKQAIEMTASGNNESFWERMGEKAITKGTKALDSFVNMKREQIAAEAQGKANEARLVATKMQTEAQLEAIRLQTGHGTLAGAPAANPTVVAPEAPANAEAAAAGVKIDPKAESQLGKRKEGVITEQEIFGQAYESIIKLRDSVVQGMPPEGVVQAVVQGLRFVHANKIDVMAFELIAQKRWADFVDILIPQTPSEYRAQVVQMLSRAVPSMGIEQPREQDSEEEDEEEDDE